MATCTNCGRYAKSGYNCSACGQKSDGGGALVIVAIYVFAGIIIGPAWMVYKSLVAEKNGAWWLIAGLSASVLSICISEPVSSKLDWPWFAVTSYCINIPVLCISIGLFFFRLRKENYQFVNLFKS